MRKFYQSNLMIFVLGIALINSCALPNSVPSQSVLPTPTPIEQTGIVVVITAQATATTEVAPTPEPDDDECNVPFYPVSDEATWMYTSSDGGNSISTMSADDFGKFTIIIEAQNSTFTIDGECSPEGVVIMNTPGAATTYSGEHGSSTVSTISVSGVTLPKDVGQGKQWTQTITVTTETGSSIIETNYTAIGFENITVPAGNFYALKVEQDGYVTVFGQKVAMHGFQWFAEGVGVVKSAMDGAPSVELVSYEIPE